MAAPPNWATPQRAPSCKVPSSSSMAEPLVGMAASRAGISAGLPPLPQKCLPARGLTDEFVVEDWKWELVPVRVK